MAEILANLVDSANKVKELRSSAYTTHKQKKNLKKLTREPDPQKKRYNVIMHSYRKCEKQKQGWNNLN
jgi:hypothetical protein